MTFTKILALDTTGNTSEVALVVDQSVVAQHSSEVSRQTETLLGDIHSTLKAASIELQALDAIVVITGPGSFTGIRTGIATARGLGDSIGVPQFGIPMPHVLALCSYSSASIMANSVMVPILPANKSEVFVSAYIQADTHFSIQSKHNCFQNKEFQNEQLLYGLLVEVFPPQSVPTLDAFEYVTAAVRVNERYTDCSTVPLYVSSSTGVKGGAAMCAQAFLEISQRGSFPEYGASGVSENGLAISLSQLSLSTANPFYLKSVNAPTLKERGIKTG